MKLPFALACLLLAARGVAAQAIVTETNVPVPMRDGVVLRAEVWRPGTGGRVPVLVYRTPYGRLRAPEDASIFARAVERGYAVMIQDVRGRYGSDGEFVAYRQEGRDGYDTIEWAARQAWSDGNIGTFGLSYPGAVQWLAALERPPHLRAMVPAMTFASPRRFFYFGGAFDLSWIEWTWNNMAPDVRVKKHLDGPKTGREARAALDRLSPPLHRRVPLNELNELKPVAPWFFEWLAHPPEDAWWDWAELGGRYDRLDGVAVLNFSAWYDEAYGPDGATRNFAGLLAARHGSVDPRTQLVIGPWTHGAPARDECKVGERDFCPSGVLDYDVMVLDWMDRYVRGIDNGVDRRKPVRYYVMGGGAWREAGAWPLPHATAHSLYLGRAPAVATVGTLGAEPGTSATPSTSFVSDAAHPVENPHPGNVGPHDNRALAARSDVLVFDSAPLERDTEATGPIVAEIHLSCDAPDTDLWVRLLDVAPDGTAYNLMSPGAEVLRASYRNGGHELLEPGRVYLLTLDHLMTSNVFSKGHRIRVQISASLWPDFSVNPQTGARETISGETRRARITIHHDATYPSRIVLPVVQR